MLAIKNTCIYTSLEQCIPKAVQQSKTHHYKDTSMKFYNKNEHLYLETDASRVRLGEGEGWNIASKGQGTDQLSAMDNRICEQKSDPF